MVANLFRAIIVVSVGLAGVGCGAPPPPSSETGPPAESAVPTLSASPVADPRIAGALTCRGPDLTFPATALTRLPIAGRSLAVALPDTFAFASWRLDPDRPRDPGSTEVAILALELSCASGAPPGDRLQPPIVIETADAVTIAIVTLKATNADCPGNPEFPVVVDLSAPLGGRTLFDGSAYPLERR